MKKIRMLVLDVDGTLTDGKIYMGEKGEVMKAFSCHDAIPIRNLPKNGIEPVILTGRTSKIVENRAKELYIDSIFQNVANKKEKLEELLILRNLTFQEVAYIGDDENDYEAMLSCGFKACPNDAVEEIKTICDYIATKDGGNGAVREIIDYLLKREANKEG